MPEDGVPKRGTTGQSEQTTLEQRVTDLEEQNTRLLNENERIKAQLDQLDQQTESGLPHITRRGALAGLLGGGALLGAAGSAAGHPGTGKDNGDPPWTPDEHDHSGEYGTSSRLGASAPVETVTARRFHSEPSVQHEAASGVSDRDIVSTKPIQIWVDPDGDNSGAGTENEPIASLQEALNRLPYVLSHPVDIVLTSGTKGNPTIHDTGGGVMSGMHMSIYHGYEEGERYFDGATGLNVAIRSESGNTDDTVLYADYFLSFSFLGNSVINVGLKNLTVEAGIQNYGGSFGCLDCVLKGSPGLDGLLFAGYAGNTFATRCEITAPVVTTDSGGGVTGLNNCTVDPGDRTDEDGEQAVLKRWGSGATVFINGGDINVPYFGTGAMGFIVTKENLYHPAAPDGII